MQPLDITIFQQVKHYHRKIINKAVILEITRFPVVEFFETYSYIREQAFKRDTIISAFEKTGIYPYNPNKIVIPIREKQQTAVRPITPPPPASLSSPPPSSSPPSESQYITPRKITEIETIETHILWWGRAAAKQRKTADRSLYL